MTKWIQREAVYLWYYLVIQIRQIAPYWALGIVLGSAVSVFGKKYIHGAVARIGQRKMGWLGVIPASLLGIRQVRNHAARFEDDDSMFRLTRDELCE